uniref:Si:dkey-243k1.3 n=1 Tax=Salmo trutta TaxID=8032 RepID=A0A674CI28_SALTR
FHSCVLILFLVLVKKIYYSFKFLFLPGEGTGLGCCHPGAARLCQRFYNRYHFATLYDTNHRIAVYSAYRFQPSNGGVYCPSQLVNLTWGAEMKDGTGWGKITLGFTGERQALNEDYTHSGFDRGHLNPMDTFPSRNATFTLTNVVPQNPKLNQNAWVRHDAAQAYVLVGAIPSTDNWIVKDNVRRVNIPEYIWNAYCCVDNNGEPVRSGGATALNTEQNRVDQRSLLELNGFLQQYSNAPVGELFHNNCQAH